MQLLSTLALNGVANGFSTSIAGNFLVHALDHETIAVVAVSSPNFIVNILKIYDGIISQQKTSFPISMGLTNSGSFSFAYPISETAFGVHFSSSAQGKNFRIDISTDEISAWSANANWPTGAKSRTTKGVLSSSGLTATTFLTSGLNVGAYRLTTVPGSDENSFNTICSYKTSQASTTPAHDYLGNGRYIAAHLGSRRGQGTFFTISVFDSDDDSVRLKGNAVISSPEIVGSISLFALSPTLAIASWSSGGVQRACAVSVDSEGNPALLGEIQLSGALGNVLYAATTLNKTTLLAGIWPSENTSPGQLVKLRVDTDAGQIVEEQKTQISPAIKSRFADFIRLTDDRFVVVSTPTVAPFGITLELVEFTE